MDSKKPTIQNILEQNTANMIFYEDSFTKTSFFTREISESWPPQFLHQQENAWCVGILRFPTYTPERQPLGEPGTKPARLEMNLR